MKFNFYKLTPVINDLVNIIFFSDFQNLTQILKYQFNLTNTSLKNLKDFNYKANDLIFYTLKIDNYYKQFLFYELKPSKKLNKVHLYEIGGTISDKLNSIKVSESSIIFHDSCYGQQTNSFIQNICEGIKLKNYIFDKYFVNKKRANQIFLKKIKVYSSNPLTAHKHFIDRERIIDSTHFVRDLVSEPANILNPDTFLDKCTKLRDLGVKVKVLDIKYLKKMGMNAISAVGQGSNFGTYVVSMEWNHKNVVRNNKNLIAFIGKGITFDTGGINLKLSESSLSIMKYDMGGAAVVTGLVKSLAERNANVNVIGLIGLAENMISNLAQRPGDVITSMSGQTIEVDNTDAEGRLILADMLWYLQKNLKAKIIIDIATLTGSIISALGYYHAGLFTNNESLAKKLYQSGKAIGENVWRLPLDKHYDNLINSKIADMKNTGRGGAGSITAAQFLQRFVKKNCAWAHLDIAGVNWLENGGPLSPAGASGYGVRLLNEFLIKNYE